MKLHMTTRRLSAFTVTACAVAVAASSLALQALAQGKMPINGVWYDDTGKGAVELRPCGNNMCGYIVWLKEPNDAKGQPLTDGYNPDASLKTRPICGLQVIGNLKPSGDGTFDGGWVYDPKVGKQYDVYIEPASRTSLAVTGYKGVKFLSKTMTWTKAPADLPKCGGAREAAVPPGPAPSAPAAQPSRAPQRP